MNVVKKYRCLWNLHLHGREYRSGDIIIPYLMGIDDGWMERWLETGKVELIGTAY